MFPGAQSQNPYGQAGPILSSGNTQGFDDPYMEHRSRKLNPFIIGGIILGAIILVLVIVSIFKYSNVPIIANQRLESLQSILEDHKDAVYYFDELYITQNQYHHLEMPLPEDKNENISAEINKMNDYLEKVKELREKIKSYSNLTVSDYDDMPKDIGERVTKLGDAIDARMKYYKKYVDVYSKLANVYLNEGNGNSLSSFKEFAGNNDAMSLYNSLMDFYSAANILDQTDCQTENKECLEMLNKYLASLNAIDNDKSIDNIMMKVSLNIKNEDVPTSIIEAILGVMTNSKEEVTNS